ncbi:MAG: hypothetical protein JNK72_02825 [Myxococcales bacterium]|nr:hypothetical protein [Myxococcales bacterium]
MSTRRFASLAIFGLLGCGEPPPPSMYSLTLRVQSDTRAMPGAVVLYRDRELGRTDNNGTFVLQTPGVEGTTLNLTVRCPAGFSPASQEVPVMLRSTLSLGDGGRNDGTETTVRCPPSQRIAAVVVRTPGHPNLPIVYNGREITRTDLQGVAHMLFRVNTGEPIALRIDTAQQPLLRPQNPTLTLTTRDLDDVYVATQNFSEEAAPRQVVRSVSRPAGPQRIPSRRTWMPF